MSDERKSFRKEMDELRRKVCRLQGTVFATAIVMAMNKVANK